MGWVTHGPSDSVDRVLGQYGVSKKPGTVHSEQRSDVLQFQGPAEVVHEQTMRDETDPGLHGC